MSDLKPECQAIYAELEHLKDCRQVIINLLTKSQKFPLSDKFLAAMKEELERLNLAIEELEQQLQNCQTQ